MTHKEFFTWLEGYLEGNRDDKFVDPRPIAKKMEEYRKLKIIGASDDAPLGYKNLDIKINGPIAEVKLEAKLATAILFIPIQLELSQIQSSAEA